MGILERALAGLGRGMVAVADDALKMEVEEARARRLAEYEGLKAQRDRAWKEEDWQKQKDWDREKMRTAHEYAMERKGMRAGRGGGAGSRWLEEEELDENGMPTGRTIREEVAGGGGGGGGSRRGGGSSGGGGGGLTRMGANGQVVNLEDGSQGLIDLRTGEVRPVVQRADSRLPEGVHGPQENAPRYERAKISDKVGTESGAKGGGDKSRYDWGGVEVEAKDILAELRAYNEGMPRSKQMTIEQFIKAQGIKKAGGGGLLGGATEAPLVPGAAESPVAASDAPTRAEPPPEREVAPRAEKPARRPAEEPAEEKPKPRPTPSRTAQGGGGKPAEQPAPKGRFREGQRAMNPQTREWLVYRNGKWIPE